VTFDCDGWRRGYDTMTVADQKAAYSEIWRVARTQSHFNVDRLAEVIEERQPRTVVELGGWDGECASIMLAHSPQIEHWVNVEVCPEAAAHYRHHRYEAFCPRDKWFWEYKWTTDLFVTSHTIEHLKARDLEATIAAVDAKTLYLDSPLTDQPQDWWGSSTTHILELGWPQVDEICARYGYQLTARDRHDLEPRSGGFSVVSVYDKP
jgi:hypothetical protein